MSLELMISLTGEAEQMPYLDEIAALGAGIELGSYGLSGVRSEADWQARLARHQAVRDRFAGPLAIHGPFLGMEFGHIDHLIRAAIQSRMDLTFGAAAQLRARRVVLHSGYRPEMAIFQIEEAWLEQTVAYWQREIPRWAGAGIEIVIENDCEPAPALLARLAEGVHHPALNLCLDIGHEHVTSRLGAPAWVRAMAPRLAHLHLHDNDGQADRHGPLGSGSIPLEPFYAAVAEHAPRATLSLEVVAPMEVRMRDLRALAARFAR